MSLTAKMDLNLSATLLTALDLVTATAPLSQTLTPLDLTSGTGANQADTIFSDTRSLAATATENIDLYTWSNALGDTQTNARIKLLLIRNKNTATGDVLRIGGLGNSGAWDSPFNSDHDATVDIQPGGYLILSAPLATGYTVTSSSVNHTLKFANTSASNTLAYDLVVIGASA